MNVELIYDNDCPNVADARQALRDALERAGQDPSWTEHVRQDSEAPEYVQAYGSPTILVDGRDVSDEGAAAEGGCCRLYRSDDGSLRGVPPIERIVRAMSEAGRSSTMESSG